MRKIINIISSLIVFCLITNAFAEENKPITLSLDDAIMLAVRSNPSVQTSRMDYVLQKFNLYVQKWQFVPHFAFQVSGTAGDSVTNWNRPVSNNGLSVQPGMSLLSPIGTKISLNASNQTVGGFRPGLSMQIVQPLMRGFGRPIVEQALNDARDNEHISRLSVENTLRGTVTSVVNAYLDAVSAQRTVIIDEEALKRAQDSVEQTRKFIKAGHKAGNELITVEANVATAESNLANDKNLLQQTRYTLLAAIGLDPNTEVNFSTLDLDVLINKYRMPTLAETKEMTLHNDIQYQTDQITLHGSKSRQLMSAYDNTRWQLNLTVNASTNSGTAGAQNADGNLSPGAQNVGINSLFNGANQSRSVNLALNIPIDDQVAKQALEGAQVALKEAEIGLTKEKWDKETGAINGWNTVSSAKRSLQFAESAAKLQQKTYDISYQKYLHGLIDSLELQSAQISLIQSQQSLLSARISYIKSLVSLDQLTGNTLKTWDVQMRLS